MLDGDGLKSLPPISVERRHMSETEPVSVGIRYQVQRSGLSQLKVRGIKKARTASILALGA
jgi:hypothetical protein